MKKKIFTLTLLAIISQLSFAQNVSDNFNDGNYLGWFDLMYNGAETWTVEGGELHLSYQVAEETPAVLLSPVGAVSDFVFDFKVGVHSIGDWCNEAGIARFSDSEGRNIIWRVDVDENLLELVYNDGAGNIELFTESVPLTTQLYSMKLEVSGTAPNINIVAWWDGIQKWSGAITNASEALAQGQLALLVSNHANTAVSMWFDDISVTYNNYLSSKKTIATKAPTSNLLSQNSPNPFSTSTKISYKLPKQSTIQLNIINNNGVIIRNLVCDSKPIGEYEISWDGRDNQGNRVAKGNYFYQLITDDKKEAKQLLYLY